MADLRPLLGPPFALFGIPATVTLIGGAVVAVTAVRKPPQSRGPAIQADAAVTDTHPQFYFARTELPELPTGSRFTIATGPDAGTWRVTRADPVMDDEVLTASVLRVA